MKELKCGSVIPGCGWQTHAESDAEIIRRACQHIRKDHGIAIITDNMMNAVKSQIQTQPDGKTTIPASAALYL